MTINKKNAGALWLITLLAVFWVVTPVASADNPRFSRIFEYELMNACVGDPTNFSEVMKTEICACALAKTQEDTSSSEYDGEIFAAFFFKNFLYYTQNREQCGGLPEANNQSIKDLRKAYDNRANKRFIMPIEYYIMTVCVHNLYPKDIGEKPNLCACAMKEYQDNSFNEINEWVFLSIQKGYLDDSFSIKVNQAMEKIQTNLHFYAQNPKHCRKNV